MSDLEFPSIDDIIKKCETTPSSKKASTKNTNPFDFTVPVSITGIGGFLLAASIISYGLYHSLRYENKLKYVSQIVCNYSDLNNSGTVDTDDENEKANLILSNIAKSNNAVYHSGKRPITNRFSRAGEVDVSYVSRFYCGNETCGIELVGKWVDEYDQAHRGELEVQK